MKATLILILLFTCFSVSYSQTKLKPLPLSSIVIGDSTFSFENISIWAPREQKHFMLGWQWQGANVTDLILSIPGDGINAFSALWQ